MFPINMFVFCLFVLSMGFVVVFVFGVFVCLFVVCLFCFVLWDCCDIFVCF